MSRLLLLTATPGGNDVIECRTAGRVSSRRLQADIVVIAAVWSACWKTADRCRPRRDRTGRPLDAVVTVFAAADNIVAITISAVNNVVATSGRREAILRRRIRPGRERMRRR